MIVALHVATGAAVGAACRSRRRAVVLGALAHFLGDGIPHHDIESRRFEIASGVAVLGLLAATRGAFDPAVVGGAAASAPDLEHVLPLPKPGGRSLFPSHRLARWHRDGGLPAWLQLLAAAAIAGSLARRSSPTV